MLSKILRIAWKVIGVLVLIALFAIVFFNSQRAMRERQVGESVAPTTGRFVSLGDVNIYIQEKGPETGPVVVLIHGTGSWSEIWRETIDPLAREGYRVIALDLPPFGYSTKVRGSEEFTREKQAARLNALFAALKLKNITLLAHSIGSRPAVEAVLEGKGVVKKLILVAPALGYPLKETSAFEFQQNKPSFFMNSFFKTDALRNAVISTYGTNPLSIQRIFSSFVYDKEAITDERTEVIKKPMNIKGTTRAYGEWLQYLVTAKDTSLSSSFDNFKMISTPTYLIWGDKDTVTPLWAGEKLAQLIPNAKISIMKNVGHMPYLENVKEFNTIVLDTLKK